ncbi:MAG: hypothetical protein K9M75_10200 [Phycisphaerae bacterium]|nr:hypothetical protein [Phycisphaerae bacterium]
MEEKKTLVWKIRTVKDYPDAHNHVFVGLVKGITDNYVRLNCKTFHYGRRVNSLKDIREGACELRIIPWSRIEVINELPVDFDIEQSKLIVDKSGATTLCSGKYVCVISSSLGERY